MFINPLIQNPSIMGLNSTLGMHPQRASAKYIRKLTENNLVIRAIHISVVTYVNVIGRSLVTQPGVTGHNHGAYRHQLFINSDIIKSRVN